MGRETRLVELPCRCLYVLGAARSEWQQSILPIPELRNSTTFRMVRQWARLSVDE
jgi:hypothetical protein